MQRCARGVRAPREASSLSSSHHPRGRSSLDLHSHRGKQRRRSARTVDQTHTRLRAWGARACRGYARRRIYDRSRTRRSQARAARAARVARAACLALPPCLPPALVPALAPAPPPCRRGAARPGSAARKRSVLLRPVSASAGRKRGHQHRSAAAAVSGRTALQSWNAATTARRRGR